MLLHLLSLHSDMKQKGFLTLAALCLISDASPLALLESPAFIHGAVCLFNPLKTIYQRKLQQPSPGTPVNYQVNTNNSTPQPGRLLCLPSISKSGSIIK